MGTKILKLHLQIMQCLLFLWLKTSIYVSHLHFASQYENFYPFFTSPISLPL